MFWQQFNVNAVTMSGLSAAMDRWKPYRLRFRSLSVVFWVAALCVCTAASNAADRTTFLVPLSSEATAAPIPENAVFPDQALGDVAGDGWRSYMRLWRAHHASPADESIRQFLGLPIEGTVKAVSKRGRSAPRWMQWRAGSYQQIDTPHFTIYSRADENAARAVALDLERCYWIWTQMFFPFWEASVQVSTTLAGMDGDVPEFLEANRPRITIKRKLRVVLFRDAAEYQQALGRDIPGIERSTGFYNDDKQTTFLYASQNDAVATRRHELVHQLFREATRSSLGQKKPGEDSGFWIIEGIAGYFESLNVNDSFATVGGWDSPRLQFARYRMLLGGDELPIRELRADGRIAAQRRQDIARWYAHSIAQTHHLLDGGNVKQRIGVYQLLGREYAIKASIRGGAIASDLERRLRAFLSVGDATILSNPIQHPVNQLCFTGCELTDASLSTIPSSPVIRWLDLSRLPIDNATVQGIAPTPSSMEQLSLEATKVGPNLQAWLAKAKRLQELDLSWTPMNDGVIKSVSTAPELAVLWMTGTMVTDASIDTLIGMRNLESVDLQRTKVTAQGIERLRKARPKLDINPLELRSP